MVKILKTYFSNLLKLDSYPSFNVIKGKKVIRHNYKRSTHPTSVPLNKLFKNNFPLSISESYADYKYKSNPLKFQNDLLSLLDFYPHKDLLGRSSEVLKVPLDDDSFINEFVIYPPNYKPSQYSTKRHLIMIHGYGSGLGFFLKNFDSLSRSNQWIIHSIDLLGYGCSSRKKFTPKSLSEVESWFHDSFATWLKKRGLNLDPQKNLVLAHSMGAYLTATYTLKSNFCKKLLMISPGAVIKHQNPVSVPKYFAKLWEQNISPFTLVRKAGPLGSKLVSGWSSRRFSKLPSNESDLLHKYAYGIFQSPGSGEYMLNYLLAPGADARHPLIDRGIEKIPCDVSWWYGMEDWMDVNGGHMCSKLINEYHGQTKSDVLEIEDSGHHLYLDNYEKFNKLVVEEMEKFREES